MLPPAETQLDIKLMITSASLTSLLCVILASFISTPVLNTQHLNCFTDLILDCLDCVWSEESVKSLIILSQLVTVLQSHKPDNTDEDILLLIFSHLSSAVPRASRVSRARGSRARGSQFTVFNRLSLISKLTKS